MDIICLRRLNATYKRAQGAGLTGKLPAPTSFVLALSSPVMRLLSTVLLALTGVAFASQAYDCVDPKVVSQTMTGENKDVLAQYLQCANQPEIRSLEDTLRFGKRQTIADVCDAPCTILQI
jgi:hypothetical protein